MRESGIEARPGNRLAAMTEPTPSAVGAGATGPNAGDGLAKPISFDARYGAGKSRALILGGGGIYFVAWQIGYLNGLARRGIDLTDAQIVAGTSAGSLVASILTAGHLRRFGTEISLLAKAPALVGALAPAANLNPSQLRALNLFRDADNARPETIREIGRAALAALTPPAAAMARNVYVMLRSRKWPAPSLHLTTVDTYTGERVVITESARVPVARACASSSAVPGLFSPQPVGDRRCMDGGVSGTGTHCDLAAGAQRVLVLSLAGAVAADQLAGRAPAATMTIQPDAIDKEIAALRAAGSATFLRAPAAVDMTELMSPAAIPKALAMADEQAAADALEFAHFWRD